jgi:hypothetical protein
MDGFEWEERDADSDSAVRFIQVDPTDVAVEVEGATVRVMRWAARWVSSHELEPNPKVVSEIGIGNEAGMDHEAIEDALEHLVEAARLLRRSRYVTCQFCEKPTAPEHQYGDEETCHSCASSEYGVVY